MTHCKGSVKRRSAREARADDSSIYIYTDMYGGFSIDTTHSHGERGIMGLPPVKNPAEPSRSLYGTIWNDLQDIM